MKNPLVQYSDFPETARDGQGKEQSINWPKTKTRLAQVDGVFLIRTTGHSFAIVYGLQVKNGLTREQAAAEFGQCCFHQAECNGLLD